MADHMDSDRLRYLLQKHFDQLLSGEELAELERMLLESSAAREEFWQMARWHALLRQWGQAEWGRRDAAGFGSHVLPAAAAVPRAANVMAHARTAFRMWQPVAIAAAVALGFLIFFLSSWPLSLRPLVQKEHTSGPVIATLSRMSAA